ncbi:hypothetical protein [Burkholderia cenocepacia]|uniref:hypothetical protein n=1 Tax=Burkholderia cenocepacia TaxID=95486 RepID=UPI0007619C48|nr:hypothetical protein [Burkholderia cenocepacia]KWU26348.1 hypothetical protein AS149_25500 [Burkholderia cenocepacia]
MTSIEQWQPIGTAPKDGRLLDLLFDIKTAELGSAEFYAPGCTRRRNPTEPLIENVAYVNGGFKPVVDADGAREVAALGGGWGNVSGVRYGIMSVTPTHWRFAVKPL